MSPTAPVPERAVLTLAVGKKIYFEMACNLARSFLLWNQLSDIHFILATDINEPLPKDLSKIEVLKIQPGLYGSGFSPKLHMDKFSQAKETLFIDADCLCASNLSHVFDKFKKWEVSVIGCEETEGELFGDIQQRCRAVGATWVPRFCGGIYYFKNGDISREVFEKARQMEKRYDDLGLVRLRGAPNEEPLIGLAMSLAGQHPIPEDGTIKAEPMYFSGRTELNVFSGKARLFNRKGQPKLYPSWKIPEEARPAVVHFNCTFAEQPPYTTEAMRLRKVRQNGWSLWRATAYANFVCLFPYTIKEKTKNVLRPLYRSLFGYREVKPSKRIN